MGQKEGLGFEVERLINTLLRGGRWRLAQVENDLEWSALKAMVLLLTLVVQVRHSLTTNMEEKVSGGRQKRGVTSPLGAVGSLAHWTIGLASQQSYQTLQVFPPKSTFHGDDIARQVLRRVSCI